MNIRIGRPRLGRSDGDLAGAVGFAGAGALVERLPHGLHTLLARMFRGASEISGGEWQKIGLARTHFRTDHCEADSLLIVDEPTSALDPEAEIAAFDRIRQLAGPRRAIVLVTHRMSGVRHADTIHVLHRGRLVEHGSHDELMAAGGRYAAMFRTQAAQYEPRRGAGTATPTAVPAVPAVPAERDPAAGGRVAGRRAPGDPSPGEPFPEVGAAQGPAAGVPGPRPATGTAAPAAHGAPAARPLSASAAAEDGTGTAVGDAARAENGAGESDGGGAGTGTGAGVEAGGEEHASRRTGTAVLLVNDTGQYLLHLRDNVPGICHPGTWSLIGGRPEGEESPEEAVARELREEAGLALPGLERYAVVPGTGPDGVAPGLIQVFLGRWNGDADALPITEGVMFRWFDAAMIDRLVMCPWTADVVRRHDRARRQSANGHLDRPS
jgi:ATP-binding cassette subfamily B protein